MSARWFARLGLGVLAFGFVYGGFNLADAGGRHLNRSPS
jgi:hypothetical protein